tara:strand:+ start:492 stop:623 length:132 start_codon:yes stop_codon:yes gene_type:complete
MSVNKKTYKTKEVNILRLSAFYEEVVNKSKNIKKEKDGVWKNL